MSLYPNVTRTSVARYKCRITKFRTQSETHNLLEWAQNSKQRIEQISQYAPLMLFLSIVALVLTIVGLISSNHQGREQLERINHAINNISTTYLSNFPDHLEHINKYLAEDPSSVSICIDVSPYAIFSSPALFEEYIGNLMMLAKKGKTHINYVVYSSQTAQSARDSFLFSNYETVSPEKTPETVYSESYFPNRNNYRINILT